MAAKSPTELNDLIGDLRRELAVLRAEFGAIQAELERTDLVRLLERLAVLESQVAEIKKRQEETDRRWWQFWLAVGVVVLTFTTNLTIQARLFFTRKPG